MKICSYGKDGGPDSTVWGFWLIEWKRLFSIALLCFENGSREAYHEHAFNSVSWVLWGRLEEDVVFADGEGSIHPAGYTAWYLPSWLPVITTRERLHKVTSVGRTWVLTFRGPWNDTWREWQPERGFTTLTHGRKECES